MKEQFTLQTVKEDGEVVSESKLELFNSDTLILLVKGKTATDSDAMKFHESVAKALIRGSRLITLPESKVKLQILSQNRKSK